MQTFEDKNIGLLTGDVQIKTEAPCLIMTTEILRWTHTHMLEFFCQTHGSKYCVHVAAKHGRLNKASHLCYTCMA